MQSQTMNLPFTNNSCPLYSFIKGELDASFNYTDDMIRNPSRYSCDSIPDTLFNGDYEGVVVQGYIYMFQYSTLMVKSSHASLCSLVNSNPKLLNSTMAMVEVISNETLMTEQLVHYFDSLLVQDSRNFTLDLKFFKQLTLFDNSGYGATDLINAFNYFMYCKEGNPYFEIFHKEWLPNIVRNSKYEKVRTLDVLFGQNVVDICGRRELTLMNRTMLCFCSKSDSSLYALSMYHCESDYVTFWIPMSLHLSLKIIELTFFVFQLLFTSIVIFYPVFVRYIKKWGDFIEVRRNVSFIEKSKRVKELQRSETPTSASFTKEIVEYGSTNNKPKDDSKNQVYFEFVRVLCDMKFLSSVCVILGMACLTMNALLFVAVKGPRGTSIYPDTTLLVASLIFLTVGNIPMALSFVEVLLKLANSNKKISILGL